MTKLQWRDWRVKVWLCSTGFLFVLFQHSLCGQDIAPPAPDRPWSPPTLGENERELSQMSQVNSNAVPIDLEKTYDLPELIDIAERSHPQTRVAWEQARAAARAVGLSKSTYYPYLAALASEDFEHELFALTTVFPGNGIEENAGVDLSWLLFDFGGRKAGVAEARQQLMLANVNFNATHQQIVFTVTDDFYSYNTSRQQVEAAQSTLDAAQVVAEAARARFDNGLGTTQDVLQAEQELAQADYDLTAAQGALDDAQVTLVRALGVFPTTQIHVAEIPEKPVPENLDEPLDDLVDRALSQRPDLLAKLATLKASQAAVRKARAAYYPQITLGASAGWTKLDVNAYSSPYVGNSKPAYAAGLEIEVPIFDGFARRNNLQLAKSQLKAAESDLADSRDTAVEQVMTSYIDLKTALRKQDAAEVLLLAAQTAFDATLESYKHGLGTYIEVQVAQRNLATARTTLVDARSAIYTSKTALALSVGDLAKPPRSAAASRNE
ncbi:MAG TPA: TolC family protein [Candidatus Sulfotelmatobacter sp.]|nr:TolC family protein [Candidatus Sulfotelmatobacter sp.]